MCSGFSEFLWLYCHMLRMKAFLIRTHSKENIGVYWYSMHLHDHKKQNWLWFFSIPVSLANFLKICQTHLIIGSIVTRSYSNIRAWPTGTCTCTRDALEFLILQICQISGSFSLVFALKICGFSVLMSCVLI